MKLKKFAKIWAKKILKFCQWRCLKLRFLNSEATAVIIVPQSHPKNKDFLGKLALGIIACVLGLLLVRKCGCEPLLKLNN